MPVNSQQKNISPKIWMGMNLIEILVVLAILAIVVALLLPSKQWASSGEIVVPVKVLVFDAVEGKPIEGASVGVKRGYGIFSVESSHEYLKRWPKPENLAFALSETTNENGFVEVDQRFHTGASHRRPESHTHLRGVWVSVSADEYGAVTVSVSHASIETAKLREQGEILVPIGLVPRSENVFPK